MIKQLAASSDGQWVAAREDAAIVLLAAGAAPAVGRLELADPEADVVFVGPPDVLVTVARNAQGDAATLVLHPPPYLEPVAELALEAPMRVVAATGQRLALAAPDRRAVRLVRAAGRALAAQAIEVAGPIEFAVGLDKQQVLFGLPKKLEVWDAATGRPVLKLGLPLPPPPRRVGGAAGHVWVTRPGSDEIYVYRLSDGRPFRHRAGAPIEDVICHPGSPLLVLVTPRGLIRLHCFAHSLTLIDDAPYAPGTPLAQLVQGEDVSLLGLAGDAPEPWRVALAGAGARPVAPPAADDEPAPPAAEPARFSAADRLRAMRGATPEPVREPAGEAAPAAAAAAAPARSAPVGRSWRDALGSYGQELARGVEAEAPLVAVDSELAELAHRLGLAGHARRALEVLYALHLAGEPALSIARLARALGDWTEPLGRGDLAALAMLRRKDGKVALRAAVADALDGAPPRAVRLAGGPATTPPAGAFRVSRDARTDAELEAELATRLGRIALVEGALPRALLEATLHGATAVALAPPGARPRPWPRGAGLVLVLYGAPSAWVADLPAL